MAQTTAEILDAAAKLEARGERVSVRKVRAELGGGNPGTIAQALKQRRETTAATTTEAAIPDNVTRALTDWAGRLAAEQVAEARAELADAREDNDALSAHAADLAQQVAEARAELAGVRQERDTIAGELRALAEREAQQAGELRALAERAAAAEARTQEMAARMQAAEERATRAQDELRAVLSERHHQDDHQAEQQPEVKKTKGKRKTAVVPTLPLD